jgi:4-amino-4-deoxy-L-arabinose transferase-like glycosyltransferase
LICGVLLLCVLVRLKFAYLRAATTFQLDYEEGNVLNAALRITNGMTPYPAAGSFPYVINPYGPVGYVLAALGIKVFGVSLLGPRLLVLLAGIGVALCIGLLAREYGVGWDVALPIAVLFFCSPAMWAWLPLLRVDLWAILLSLIGLCVFAHKPERWPIAALVFALALLTKLTAGAAAAACFLELLAQGKTSRALRFSALTAIIVIAGATSLGGSPLFHLLRTHPDAFSLTHLLRMYWAAIEQSSLTIAILIYSVAFGFRWSPETRLP